MPAIPSIMSLHLRYRLLIAELNADINVLRIFEDYIQELKNLKAEQEVESGIDHYHKQFEQARTEIDELRHEMHMMKMQFGEYSRKKKKIESTSKLNQDRIALKRRYLEFRKFFEKSKKDFGKFEAKWL
jgi:phage shock protein A